MSSSRRLGVDLAAPAASSPAGARPKTSSPATTAHGSPAQVREAG
ncbi:hypothetical protein ACWF9B_21810 [Streptomyces sp. NPDC055089]